MEAIAAIWYKIPDVNLTFKLCLEGMKVVVVPNIVKFGQAS